MSENYRLMVLPSGSCNLDFGCFLGPLCESGGWPEAVGGRRVGQREGEGRTEEGWAGTIFRAKVKLMLQYAMAAKPRLACGNSWVSQDCKSLKILLKQFSNRRGRILKGESRSRYASRK